MKNCAIVFTFFLSSGLFAKQQSTNRELIAAVKSGYFERIFNICDTPNESLTIIDTSKYFRDSFSVCGRRIYMSDTLPFKIDVNRGSGIETKNKIFLEYKKMHKYFVFSFYNGYSNTNLILRVYYRNKKIEYVAGGSF